MQNYMQIMSEFSTIKVFCEKMFTQIKVIVVL